jgi:hypothetical protein
MGNGGVEAPGSLPPLPDAAASGGPFFIIGAIAGGLNPADGGMLARILDETTCFKGCSSGYTTEAV